MSFVGDPIEDSPELAAQRDALPDLEQTCFVCNTQVRKTIVSLAGG